MRWADIPQLSTRDRCCPAAWQQYWQQSHPSHEASQEAYPPLPATPGTVQPGTGSCGSVGRGDWSCGARSMPGPPAPRRWRRAARPRRRSGRSASRACRRPQRCAGNRCDCGRARAAAGACTSRADGAGTVPRRARRARQRRAPAGHRPARPGRRRDGGRADGVHDDLLRLVRDRSLRLWAGQRRVRYPTFYGCPNRRGLA